jgi:hypothetical protein
MAGKNQIAAINHNLQNFIIEIYTLRKQIEVYNLGFNNLISINKMLIISPLLFRVQNYNDGFGNKIGDPKLLSKQLNFISLHKLGNSKSYPVLTYKSLNRDISDGIRSFPRYRYRTVPLMATKPIEKSYTSIFLSKDIVKNFPKSSDIDRGVIKSISDKEDLDSINNLKYIIKKRSLVPTLILAPVIGPINILEKTANDLSKPLSSITMLNKKKYTKPANNFSNYSNIQIKFPAKKFYPARFSQMEHNVKGTKKISNIQELKTSEKIMFPPAVIFWNGLNKPEPQSKEFIEAEFNKQEFKKYSKEFKKVHEPRAETGTGTIGVDHSVGGGTNIIRNGKRSVNKPISVNIPVALNLLNNGFLKKSNEYNKIDKSVIKIDTKMNGEILSQDPSSTFQTKFKTKNKEPWKKINKNNFKIDSSTIKPPEQEDASTRPQNLMIPFVPEPLNRSWSGIWVPNLFKSEKFKQKFSKEGINNFSGITELDYLAKQSWDYKSDLNFMLLKTESSNPNLIIRKEHLKKKVITEYKPIFILDEHYEISRDFKVLNNFFKLINPRSLDSPNYFKEGLDFVAINGMINPISICTIQSDFYSFSVNSSKKSFERINKKIVSEVKIPSMIKNNENNFIGAFTKQGITKDCYSGPINNSILKPPRITSKLIKLIKPGGIPILSKTFLIENIGDFNVKYFNFDVPAEFKANSKARVIKAYQNNRVMLNNIESEKEYEMGNFGRNQVDGILNESHWNRKNIYQMKQDVKDLQTKIDQIQSKLSESDVSEEYHNISGSIQIFKSHSNKLSDRFKYLIFKTWIEMFRKEVIKHGIEV